MTQSWGHEAQPMGVATVSEKRRNYRAKPTLRDAELENSAQAAEYFSPADVFPYTYFIKNVS
jgi:hypothetical protein